MKKLIKRVIIILTVIILAGLIVFGIIKLYNEIEKKKKLDAFPKIYIQGNVLDIENKSEERKVTLKYKDKDLEFETNAKIKWQGQTSLAYQKKNYYIKFYEDDNCKEKKHIDMGRGWGKYYKYCLKANWTDTKTHARNIVAANLSAEVQAKYNLFKNTPNNGTIDGYPVAVYINNEFQGVYTLNIPKSEWLWGLDEENPNNIALMGEMPGKAGFFESEIQTLENHIKEWEIEVGEETQETIDKFNRVINFVKDSTDEEFVQNFEEYINKDAMLNYIVMIYWTNATDNLSRNMAMVTYDGKVWYPTLYDLDGTFGTNPYGGDASKMIENLEEDKSLLFSRVSKLFKKEIANRYFELRKEILTIENTMNKFKEIYNKIPEEIIQKEKEKWDNPNKRGINEAREYLENRVQYLDKVMSENL